MKICNFRHSDHELPQAIHVSAANGLIQVLDFLLAQVLIQEERMCISLFKTSAEPKQDLTSLMVAGIQ
jgi:hypothetical protein